jgi:hypothetical protein
MSENLTIWEKGIPTPRRAALAMIAAALDGSHLDVRDILEDYLGDRDELAVALALWAAVLVPDKANAKAVCRINLATLYAEEVGT